MQYRPLGRTGLNVSSVALGCWTLVGGLNWGDQEEAESIDTVRAALEAGVTLFDTAEAYGDGQSERLIGKALAGRRGEVVIASKVSDNHLRPEQVAAACEASLANLGTDWIDLYQIHWPNREVPMADTLGAMQRLQEQGKIRHVGVCNFGRARVDEALGIGGRLGVPVASDQLIYSLLTRAIEFDVRPRCAEAGASILAYSPLAQGLLTGKFTTADDVPPGRARTRHFSNARPHTRHGESGCEAETFDAIRQLKGIAAEIGSPLADVALAWCLHQPGVTAVLAGARTREQVFENARAADLRLTPEQVRRLTEATEPVKRALGPSLDLWEGAAAARV